MILWIPIWLQKKIKFYEFQKDENEKNNKKYTRKKKKFKIRLICLDMFKGLTSILFKFIYL